MENNNKKTIIYKIDYELKDAIKKQIEWSNNSCNQFSSEGINFDIPKGSLIIFKTYDYIKCEYMLCYGVTLHDSLKDNNNNELIVCPIIFLNKGNINSYSGIDIGKIISLNAMKEAKALINRIKPIDRRIIKVLFDKNKKSILKLEDFVIKRILLSYTYMLEKLSFRKQDIVKCMYC